MFTTAADLQVGQKITSAMAAGFVSNITRTPVSVAVSVTTVRGGINGRTHILHPDDTLEVEGPQMVRTIADQLVVGDRFKFGHRLHENRDTWTVVSVGPRDDVGAWDMTVTSDHTDVRSPVILPSIYPEDRILIVR